MIHKHGKKNSAPNKTVLTALLELPAVTSDLINEKHFFFIYFQERK